MMLSMLLKLSLLAPLAYAYTTISTTCSSSNVTTNFVSGPDRRGTLDILWSCLFTIFACTWTIQHLNVPEQRDGRDPGWCGDIKWRLKSFLTSLNWMLITVIAPEYLLMKSLDGLAMANKHLSAFQELATADGVPWTLSHSVFADMGGFIIKVKGRSGAKATVDGYTEPSELRLLDSENGREANSSLNGDILGLEQYGLQGAVAAGICDTYPFHLDAAQLLALRLSGLLSPLPNISTEELNDKSKSDAFSKTITVAQIFWLTFQVSLRKASGLAISQLELAAVAFSACAVIIYGVNFSKPKNVQVPHVWLSYDSHNGIPSEIIRICEQASNREKSEIAYLLGLSIKDVVVGSAVPNDSVSNDGRIMSSFVLFVAASLLFGAIHVAGWNYTFPTRVDQLIWRAASVWITVFMFMYSGLRIVLEDTKAETPVVFITAITYILARIALMVEVFRTLFYLPPSTFVATFAASVPHLG